MEVATARRCNPEISQSFASDQRRFNELAEKLAAMRELGTPAPRAQDSVPFFGRS
jgi:hypothetical protein